MPNIFSNFDSLLFWFFSICKYCKYLNKRISYHYKQDLVTVVNHQEWIYPMKIMEMLIIKYVYLYLFVYKIE